MFQKAGADMGLVKTLVGVLEDAGWRWDRA